MTDQTQATKTLDERFETIMDDMDNNTTSPVEREEKFRKVFADKGLRYPTVEETLDGLFAVLRDDVGMSLQDVMIIGQLCALRTKHIIAQNDTHSLMANTDGQRD